MSTPRTDATALLEALRHGDSDAFEDLLALLYKDLRRIAAKCFRAEREGHTLQPTALVHEAYLRLVDQHDMHWQSRAHFLNAAAQAMRRILVDHARSRQASKRGGAGVRVTLDDGLAIGSARDPDLLALDDALRTLAERDPRKAQIVELRYFGGLTTIEVAEVLGVSVATVERDWAVARVFLHRELGGNART
jgi:RNA polymerase sigma factor (TIGR02999 family)